MSLMANLPSGRSSVGVQDEGASLAAEHILAVIHLFGNACAQLGIILSLSVLCHGLSPWDNGIYLLGHELARWGDLPGQVLEAVTGFAPGHRDSTEHFSIEVDGCKGSSLHSRSLSHDWIEESTGELLCMRQAPKGKSSRCSLPNKRQHALADAFAC